MTPVASRSRTETTAAARRPRSGRRRAGLVALLCVALALPVAVVAVLHRGAGCEPMTPVAVRATDDLAVFTRWLRRNDARGFVGEVGWPSDEHGWRPIADSWFDRADASGLWVTVWAAGRWWPSDYRMVAYRLSGHRGTPADPGGEARVLADHPGPPGTLRGVVLPSGAFGAGRDGPPSYSASRPGVYGRDYYYDDETDFRQLARQGISVVRLSFTWERIQRRLDGPLDTEEVGRLRQALAGAAAAGVGVVLDLHNYGDYWLDDGRGGHTRAVLGTPRLPATALADVWRRLVAALDGAGSVIGFGLMNEPTDLAEDPARGARTWQDASQRAVEAIRAAGRHETVFVSGYGGASPTTWATYHPQAWIRDPDDQVRYEAHQYFDADRSGRYASTFPAELRLAAHAGYAATCGHPVSASLPGGPLHVPSGTPRR